MDLIAARRLARTLMTQHGVGHWKFDWDNSLSRFGACHQSTQKITLSKNIVPLNPESEVRQTILHEIAHALAGPKAKHGPAWKRIARSIGYTGQRTHNAAIPEYRFIGKCPVCPTEFPRHRRKANVFHPACAAKHGYSRGNVPAHMMIQWVDTQAVKA